MKFFLIFFLFISPAFAAFPGMELPVAGYTDKVLPGYTVYGSAFPDMNVDTLEGKAATELKRRGALGGFPDGTFRGDEPVNRAQAAKILLYSRYQRISTVQNTNQFSDVTGNDAWYIPFVINASKKGIILGYPNGSFQPGNNVNTIEFLAMMTRTFGLQTGLDFSYTDVAPESWIADYAGIAQKYNLFPNREGVTLRPAEPLTRSEVAVALYQYFRNRSYPVMDDTYHGVDLLTGTHTATLETSLGDITLEINADAAPIAATSFIEHARDGYYSDMIFHRVIPDFMIQGGDPTGTGTGGESVYGKDFEDEQNDLSMDRGVIAMANAGPNTNGSQFFIVQAAGGASWLQGNHTIFGRVLEGMDVVDAIVGVDRDAADRPLTDVTFSAEVD